jgi:hypothetical protein
LTWLLVVPLVVLGSQAAHAVEYWFAAPDPDEREQLLTRTGHAYLEQAPIGVALCLGLVVLALLGRFLQGRRGARPGSALGLMPFAVLPPAVFVLQEHLERLFHDGVFPLDLAFDPMFLVGLVLQLPFGQLAYLLGRALLSAADQLARGLGSTLAFRVTPPLIPDRTASAADLPRLRPLATCRAGRGPPLAA